MMNRLQLRIDLKEWARTHHTSIRRMALDAGLTPTVLYKTLAGQQSISADFIVGVLVVTGLTFEELFTITRT